MCGLKGGNTIDSLPVRSQNSLEPREVFTGSGELGVEYSKCKRTSKIFWEIRDSRDKSYIKFDLDTRFKL